MLRTFSFKQLALLTVPGRLQAQRPGDGWQRRLCPVEDVRVCFQGRLVKVDDAESAKSAGSAERHVHVPCERAGDGGGGEWKGVRRSDPPPWACPALRTLRERLGYRHLHVV